MDCLFRTIKYASETKDIHATAANNNGNPVRGPLFNEEPSHSLQ